ncbi:heterokaryon incompatibility protein-domain-containing protein [Xylaria grammica]|nr:heterokaryon incompatibility protein-domain-containing protein [Xylaria grammica]
MRLLNTSTHTLETFTGAHPPNYAILSHTWSEDEVLFEDIRAALHDESADESEQKWRRKSGARKILDAAKKSSENGFDYIWIDTCCIDKSSSAELSEAINSMYRWYHQSAVCYVYLSDVDSSAVEPPFQDGWSMPMIAERRKVTFKKSRWFRRGWTVRSKSLNPQFMTRVCQIRISILMHRQLQELIAPREVFFFDGGWSYIGSRGSLATTISDITQIDTSLLEDRTKFPTLEIFSIHTRMTWAHGRETTRPEDRAYSMMGIFGVNMPLLYGEGPWKAFMRLQGEIIKESNDQSILLHTNQFSTLAWAPQHFSRSHKFEPSRKSLPYGLESTSSGHRTSLLLHPNFKGSVLAILEVGFADDPSILCRPAIRLKPQGADEFVRGDSTVYRVRLGSSNQLEVWDLKSYPTLHGVLHHSELQRSIVKLCKRDFSRPPTESDNIFRDQHLRLHPLVHSTGSKSFEYASWYRMTDNPLIHRSDFVEVSKDLYLVAAISLEHLRHEDSSVTVLIFAQAEVESWKTELCHTLNLRCRYVFPYLANSRSLLGEWADRSQSPPLKGILDRLSDLRSLRGRDDTLTRVNLYNAILKEVPKQDSGSRFLLSNSEGLQVKVSLNWFTFLETKILEFGAEILNPETEIAQEFVWRPGGGSDQWENIDELYNHYPVGYRSAPTVTTDRPDDALPLDRLEDVSPIGRELLLVDALPLKAPGWL